MRALGDRPPPLLQIVMGTAGTGKSFLINTLADALTKEYTTEGDRAQQPAVVIGAPTGLAAVLVGGSTVHSVLAVEVQHGRDAEMKALPPVQLNKRRVMVSVGGAQA